MATGPSSDPDAGPSTSLPSRSFVVGLDLSNTKSLFWKPQRPQSRPSPRLRNDDARYAQERTARERGDSAAIMVAGACYEVIHNALAA